MRKMPKISIGERLNLGLIAPIKYPFSVELDVSSYCNLNCQFCFRNCKENCDKINQCFMEFSLYKKIIDELEEFSEPVKKLKLSWGGEPLLNPQLPEMIAYAKKRNVAEGIEITTNAIALTKEMSDRLVDSGIDRINISINGVTDGDYKKYTNRVVDTQKLRDEIRYLYNNRKETYIYIKLGNVGYPETSIDTFYEMYGECADSVFVENILDNAFEGGRGLGELKGAYGQEISNKSVCPFIFTRLMINADGCVSLCCMDWSCSMSIGNCKLDNICDIWNSEKLHDIQLMHLKKCKEKIELCKHCKAIDAFTVDNIDDYTDDILARMHNMYNEEKK